MEQAAELPPPASAGPLLRVLPWALHDVTLLALRSAQPLVAVQSARTAAESNAAATNTLSAIAASITNISTTILSSY